MSLSGAASSMVSVTLVERTTRTSGRAAQRGEKELVLELRLVEDFAA